MDVLVGHSYTWERAFIQFHKEGRLATPWVRGTYTVLDTHRVTAEWAGFTHILTFDTAYSQFTSVRTSDQNTVVGHRLRPDQLSTIPSLHIDYKHASTELCHMGKRYNVDKSSQRENPGPDDSHHCHPYSLFYHALFQKRRQDPLVFCEIGIAEGRSLLLWDEYFPNATIYGFEYMSKWLLHWKNNYSHKTRIHVDYMNVQKEADIVIPFQNTNTMFDCIIDDSSHLFYDMIRIIRLAKNFLKPGGMIILEDVRREYDEAWFYNELKDVLDEFQTVFFVDLDHARRNSGDVNNDKLLVLVKKGVPVFECSFF